MMNIEQQIKGFFTRCQRIVKTCNACGVIHTYKSAKDLKQHTCYVRTIKSAHSMQNMHVFNCSQCSTPLYYKEKE